MPETATVQITMPEMGESVTEGIVLEWHVAEGDSVKEGDTVVEVSTDKVDAEVPAPMDGVITKLVAAVDDEVPVGAPLAEMEAGNGGTAEGPSAGGAGPVAAGDPPPAAEQQGVPPTTPPTPKGGDSSQGSNGSGNGSGADVRATPVARRVAEANGVDLGSVKGSGPGAKVTKDDVLQANGGGNGASATASAQGEAKQLRGAAAMLANAMDESRAVPTATSFRTIAVDTLDAKRKAINSVLKDRGLKVSFTHLIAWAIVEATKQFPVMVRVFAEEDGKPFAIDGSPVNLGIAVDVEKKDGSHTLMVPAIKGADGLDFPGFHSRYEELIAKTRENKLSADDFQGTNISLTNPGGIGTMASVPRLLSGQSAIIATGSIAYPPEWKHASPERLKQLGVSKVMTLTSTYDHRVIQGAESGAFLRRVEELLQGEDGFYEAVAADLGFDAALVTNAHPASASAPPLSAAAPTAEPSSAPDQIDEELLQAVQAATSLLKAYRTHGHLAAQLDPLGSEPKGDPALQPENVNLTPELMSRIPASILRIGVPGETLLEALPRMRDAYCGTIGYQVEHLSSHQQRIWLREMIETGAHRQPLTDEEKKRLLNRLIDVFQFERFLEKAYLGQKMFSIEGLDAVVPMLDEVVTLAERASAEEVVFGMAHRGRLSVLAHNLGRSVESILAEFEGSKQIDAVKAVASIPHGGTGDVKYHYGHRGVYETGDGKKISVRLYPNPSHLEFVDPVVTGGTRFLQQDFEGPNLTHEFKRAVPVLLHGDAAFPAQGVVAETLNLQALPGYNTGGTVHLIQNNQVGFTTDPEEARSTRWASDLAKGFDVPIMHVNADDVAACVAAVRLGFAFRQEFGHDVVIDLIGYRRWGHNEADEPAYTQPEMAARIKEKTPVRDIFAQQLVDRGVLSQEEADAIQKEIWDGMGERHRELKEELSHASAEQPTGGFQLDRSPSPEVKTAVSADRLNALNEDLLRLPEGFNVHPKLKKQLERRRETV
ncbi:MAG: multifunctional oxoglutarate decarboxylase/oxoglutarate dehydrogenase thiamine pyrophosphate-binding subunit/dihydrolipoyllysine-residue succinyltransferase subunit, partial [Solirubrobacterales bacterium]